MAQGAVIIIPARFGSERFPGKPLASETGKPLIQHVVEAALKCRRVERVVVATDDDRIATAVRGFGGECVMTQSEHPNGTSRLAEAATALELEDERTIVNVQGDEPEIEAAVIEAVIEALESSQAPMATVGSPFAERENAGNPNIVKVVRRLDGRALYFSRALVPFNRDGSGMKTGSGGEIVLKHVGVYAYRRWFLREFAELSETPLERTERLEQLRALEHGYEIAVGVAKAEHHGIDTPEQYAEFVKRQREG